MKLAVAVLCLTVLCHSSGIRFSATERDVIVAAHNEARESVTPTASKMPAVVWDDALAQAAFDHAKNCPVDPKDGEFGHASSLNGQGENLHMSSGPIKNVASAVSGWDGEKMDYNFATGACSGRACGHYTQVVFEKTTKIGCAKNHCTNYRKYPYGLVCRYDRMRFRPIYTPGPSCSQCPAGQKCLCNKCTFERSAQRECQGAETNIGAMTLAQCKAKCIDMGDKCEAVDYAHSCSSGSCQCYIVPKCDAFKTSSPGYDGHKKKCPEPKLIAPTKAAPMTCEDAKIAMKWPAMAAGGCCTLDKCQRSCVGACTGIAFRKSAGGAYCGHYTKDKPRVVETHGYPVKVCMKKTKVADMTSALTRLIREIANFLE